MPKIKEKKDYIQTDDILSSSDDNSSVNIQNRDLSSSDIAGSFIEINDDLSASRLEKEAVHVASASELSDEMKNLEDDKEIIDNFVLGEDFSSFTDEEKIFTIAKAANNGSIKSPIENLIQYHNIDIKKIDLNAVYEIGLGLIHHASGSKNFIEFLINNKANVNLQDINGNTVLHMTACASIGRGDIIELLLNNGANPNIRDRNGNTALHAIAEAFVFPHRDYSKAAELLIKSGIDINARNKDGKTALDIAIEINQPKLINFLVLQGAEVNISYLPTNSNILQQVIPEESVITAKSEQVMPEESVITAKPKQVIPEESVTIAKPKQVTPEKSVTIAKSEQVIPEKSVTIDKSKQVIPEKSITIAKPKQVIPEKSVTIAKPEQVIPETSTIIAKPKQVMPEKSVDSYIADKAKNNLVDPSTDREAQNKPIKNNDSNISENLEHDVKSLNSNFNENLESRTTFLNSNRTSNNESKSKGTSIKPDVKKPEENKATQKKESFIELIWNYCKKIISSMKEIFGFSPKKSQEDLPKSKPKNDLDSKDTNLPEKDYRSLVREQKKSARSK